jgi:hypothetical protein
MNKLQLTFLIMLMSISIGYSNVSYSELACNNEIELLTSENNSFQFQIRTSLGYECTLYEIVDGNYEKMESKIGNGNSTLTFNSIKSDAIYKVVVEFNDSEQLCKTRQISGLKL